MIPKAIAGSANWFYVRVFPNGIDAEILHVAAWGLDIHGNVGGLVASPDVSGDRDAPVLLSVKPGGRYVHRDQLDDEQRKAIEERRAVYPAPR